jgi:hypothetical protein
LLGYNNAVVGASHLRLLRRYLPQIDTVHTTGSHQAENARIQGTETFICA